MKKRTLQFRIMAKTILFILLLGVVGTMKGYAESFTVDNLRYTVNSDGASVTVNGLAQGVSASGSLVIPGTVTYNGISYSVTLIGNYAFSNCIGFTENLTIPNSVTSIGDYAFRNCSGFTGSLTIGNSVTSIGKFAFEGCNGFMGNLVIPESVNSIGARAFKDCSNFTYIYYNAPNCPESYIYSGYTQPPFLNCGGNLIIGNNVVQIPRHLFRGANIHGTLTIPNSLITIGASAFYNCIGLTGDLIIPNSVTTIEGDAFNGCSGFSGTLTIGNSVVSIGGGAFSGCTGFTGDLVIPNSVTTIYDAFNGCSGFSGVLTIGNSVVLIGSGAFSGCTGFTGELIIPNSVISIGSNAFQNCSGFTGTLTFPDSLTEIGAGAFSGCIGFSSQLSIPSSVSTINCETNPFYGTAWYDGQEDGVLYLDDWCLGYKGEINPTVTIPEGILHIAGSAFMNNSTITSISIPNTVTNIGPYAFQMCENLTSVIIPNSVTDIGSYAFQMCENLTSVVLSNSLTTINWGTFAECSHLNSIELPESLTTIDELAFRGCGFSTIIIPNSVTDIGSYAFANDYLCSIVLGNSVVSIGESAFETPDVLHTVISFSETPPLLGNYAFTINPEYYGVTGTVSIYVPANAVNSYQISSGWNEYGNIEPMTLIDDLIYSYNNTDNTASVLGVIGDMTNNMEIPSIITIENAIYSVVSIHDAAISYNKELVSIHLPNTLVSIGGYALYGCNELVSIQIPNSVISIGSYAFFGCSSLTFIIVRAETPPTITSSTFYNCPKSIPVYVPCGSSGAYQTAAYWRKFTNIQEVCTQSQTVTLSAGWNWFSPNVEITLDDLQNALVDALPNANAIMIKSKNGITTYNGETWRGQLDSLDVTQMYRISVGTDCEITLSGMPINPAEHPVTIHNGANWIGFPLNENMTLSDAFAGFVVAGDMVKSKNGVATYNGTSWRGSLNTLEPGQGYIFNSNVQGDRIFTFPIGAK